MKSNTKPSLLALSMGIVFSGFSGFALADTAAVNAGLTQNASAAIDRFNASVSGGGSSSLQGALSNYSPNPNKYGSAPSMSDATPGTTSGDANYARIMRIEYAKSALTNSTSQAEANLTKNSMSSQDCIGPNGMVMGAHNAKVAYTQRHMAPDPTRIIKSTTCFVDVFSIPIPQTGFGFVDVLVGNLVQMFTTKLCNSTTGFWSNIASAVASGNVSGLQNMAISSTQNYVQQSVSTSVNGLSQNAQNQVNGAVSDMTNTGSSGFSSSGSGSVVSSGGQFQYYYKCQGIDMYVTTTNTQDQSSTTSLYQANDSACSAVSPTTSTSSSSGSVMGTLGSLIAQ
jgi:hypothetical protein